MTARRKRASGGESIRIDAAVRKYGLSRTILRDAITAGDLELHTGGWLDELQLVAWIKSRPRGPKATAALAAVEAAAPPAPRQDVEVEVQRAAKGGALVSQDFLDELEGLYIPAEAIQQAERAAAVNKARQISLTAVEKHMRAMQESGRLADVRELEQLANATLQRITTTIKTLEVQIASAVSRKHKLKLADVKKVLVEARVFLVQELLDEAQRHQERAEQFMLDKTAEVRRRNRR